MTNAPGANTLVAQDHRNQVIVLVPTQFSIPSLRDGIAGAIDIRFVLGLPNIPAVSLVTFGIIDLKHFVFGFLGNDFVALNCCQPFMNVINRREHSTIANEIPERTISIPLSFPRVTEVSVAVVIAAGDASEIARDVIASLCHSGGSE